MKDKTTNWYFSNRHPTTIAGVKCGHKVEAKKFATKFSDGVYDGVHSIDEFKQGSLKNFTFGKYELTELV